MPTPWSMMDPQRAADALGMVVVLSALLERALSLVFESRVLGRVFARPASKRLVMLVGAEFLAWNVGFDAPAMAGLGPPVPAGIAVTGLMMSLGAGGAKQVFVRLLGIHSGFLDEVSEAGGRRGPAWPQKSTGRIAETTKAGVKSWRFTLRHSG